MQFKAQGNPRRRWTLALFFSLTVVAMLSVGVACGGEDEAATAVPPFSLPTDLPSQEAVGDGGGEATAAVAGSDYWSGPRTWEPEDVSGLERVTQELVAPPFFPDHEQVNTGDPRVVEIRMVVEEKEIEVAPGVFMWAFTFHGSVPGPIIVVHEGDYVELTLVNPSSNELLHNIDLHASSGALGGGALTQVGPGQEVVLRFRATKAGVFIYHCAPGGTMVPWHVVHGMNGAIMVLPREGLRDPAGNSISYDRAYYVGEQDYYLPRDENGEFKRYESPSASMVDDLAAMKTLIPTHIVFNGVTGALQGDGQLTDGQRGRKRADYPLTSQPAVLSAPDWRARRLRLGARRVQQSAGGGPGDVGGGRRFRRGVDSHDSTTGNLCLPVAQPHRGVRVRRQGDTGGGR